MKIPQVLAIGFILSSVGFMPEKLSAQIVCRGLNLTSSTDPRCKTGDSTPLFWIPDCGTSIYGSQPPVGSGIEKTVVIYNRQPSRRLQLNGRNGDDIMIGSPGTSENLSGGAGSNTFVVGNAPARLVVDPAGTNYVVPATNETDRLTLVSSGIDFINIKPNGQRSPGTITIANPGRLTTITRPMGLANPPSSPVAPCPSAAVRLFPGSSPSALLAMKPNVFSPGLLLAKGVDSQPILEEELPGVPIVVDFELDKDQIILTEELVEGISSLQSPSPYIYANYSLSDGSGESTIIAQPIERKQKVSILVINGVSFSHVSTTSKFCRKELNCLLDTSRGLTNVPTNLSPLVYFQKQGLLVSSRMGDAPLGSRDNPGRVVVRLMNGNGSALKLPVSPKNPIYKASFITFQPRESEGQPCEQKYPHKGYSCPLRDQKGSPYQTHSGERYVRSAMAPALP